MTYVSDDFLRAEHDWLYNLPEEKPVQCSMCTNYYDRDDIDEDLDEIWMENDYPCPSCLESLMEEYVPCENCKELFRWDEGEDPEQKLCDSCFWEKEDAVEDSCERDAIWALKLNLLSMVGDIE